MIKTQKQLLGLSVNPIIRLIKRLVLQSKLRTLYQAASYFKWQQDNGHAGLADTHKRIAILESELRSLR